jgi:hypothetical protein
VPKDEEEKESLLKNQLPTTTRRPLGMQRPLDPLEFFQDWMLRDMHVASWWDLCET